MRPGPWGAAPIGAALLSAVLLAAGCSSGSGSGASPSPTPSATSAAASPTATSVVCMNVAALRASLAELGHISVGPNALDKLKKDLTVVKDNLAAVKESAGTEWSAQIDGVQTALSKLQKTLSNLGSQPNAAAAAKAVSTDVAGLTRAGSNLLAAASERCPEATPTPSG
ncbi:MAG TPA: hypothetical protein VIP48_01945 [Streptosporangiaceae bacterium]